MAWQMKAALRTLTGEPNSESAFGVRAAFYNPTLHRRDLDNLLKLVCDAATGVIWKDDTQVTEIHAVLSRGTGDGLTDVLIYTNGAITTRTAKCGHCGRVFKTYPSWPYKTYCSRPCQITASRTGVDLPCRHCGKMIYVAPHRTIGSRTRFCSKECRSLSHSRESTCPQCSKVFRLATSRRVAKHEFCTRECAIAYFRARPIGRAAAYCEVCGAGVSRKNYTRCRVCKMDAHDSPTSNYWRTSPI